MSQLSPSSRRVHTLDVTLLRDEIRSVSDRLSSIKRMAAAMEASVQAVTGDAVPVFGDLIQSFKLIDELKQALDLRLLDVDPRFIFPLPGEDQEV
jgi:hypothetical protein